MQTMKVHFLSRSNEWATPPALFARLHDEFHFTLDPCASDDNHKCEKYFTKADNGLLQSWAGEVVFMNPPYGREIGLWVEKAYRESDAIVVCLIPARTDTRYWHEYCMKASEIRFIAGRVKFGDGCQPAPFPSCLVVFGVGQPNTACSRTGGYAPASEAFYTPKISSVKVADLMSPTSR